MRRTTNGIGLSASDLVRYTACSHATRLDLAHLHGEGPEPAAAGDDALLLQAYGEEHEARYLADLEGAGKSIIRIEKDAVSMEEAVQATREALCQGPDVIYQAALQDGLWGGYADFLERVEKPSDLGGFSYEVVDAKLKRSPSPEHVLQLVLYSDLLGKVQGLAPEKAHLQLGAGARESLTLSEYAAYAQGIRRRLEEFVQQPSETRPIPCPSCDLCRWREHCGARWKEEDSLFQVAGITKSQVAKLENAGIMTMAVLARRASRVPRLAKETQDKLAVQARLQDARKQGAPTCELRKLEPGKGFFLMPQPNPGDLFYDIEGDPYYREGDTEGLEYLHGVWDGTMFHAYWGHDLREEKEALERLFKLFQATIARHPEAHIYHYAPYEITALRKITMRHRFGEAQMDQWLRERRFVDLYAVVRGGIIASEPSYSIKDMEAFYDVERKGEVTTSGGSITAYERWRETREQTILDELEEYNRIDCESTEKLRDWLLDKRPEVPWRTLGEGKTEHANKIEDEFRNLFEIIDRANLFDARTKLLKDLAVFHWRESKPAAWAVFAAAEKEFEDLCEDMDCLAGLEAKGRQRYVKRSVERMYRYPQQGTKLHENSRPQFAIGENQYRTVTISALNRTACEVTLRIGMRSETDLPARLDLLPNFALNTRPIPEAIRAVIADQCGMRENRAAEDLLARNAPRFVGDSPLPLTDRDDVLDGFVAAAKAMDATVLPVQGPPGTGKTYVSACAICALVQAGYRIGVSSNSHAAILNVLTACVDAFRETGSSTRGIVHKASRDAAPLPEGYGAINRVYDNKAAAIGAARIVGGTAWLFSREDQRGAFDYLFVDEAGQVSLANLVAMSNCARNLVLIGDPRQLPQVIQGAHPYPANLSCLDWVLGPGQNVAPERGIFLPLSWRMHPALCGYISTLYYNGRLGNHPSTANQVVRAPGLPQAGAFRMSVDHSGRTQECPEEIKAIQGLIQRLCAGAWTDREGVTRALTPRDIIVVAPYNAQVHALSQALKHVRVGTVDKFQGQEAAVALVSMTASSSEETMRGIDFLLSRERLNVAVSRGKVLSIVVASPRLLHTHCSHIAHMRLVNALCALQELPMETPGMDGS